jgi:hypothetical protein
MHEGVGDQSAPSTVPVWKGMNQYDAVVQTHGHLIKRED